MRVLSLFDGISAGQLALQKVGVKVTDYYAAEIDKYTIQITQKNFPNTIQLGDVENFESWDIDWSTISLVTGGFPCQAWSTAGKQLGDKDERGKLFWVMLEIIKKVLIYNPNAAYLIENVKMKKEFEKYITFHTEQALGRVDKHLINSNLFSAQNRSRYYWTNIPVPPLPISNDLLLSDVLEIDVPEKYFVDANSYKTGSNQLNSDYKSQANTIHDAYKKSPSLCAFTHGYAQGYIKEFYLNDREIERATLKYSPTVWKSGNKMGRMQFPDSVDRKSKTLCSTTIKADRATHHLKDFYGIRRLTPVEFERLQTFPDNYTAGVSNTQRYKMIGNSWTVDVIVHILKNIK
jgi:DNA-cytosine methyltransferase